MAENATFRLKAVPILFSEGTLEAKTALHTSPWLAVAQR